MAPASSGKLYSVEAANKLAWELEYSMKPLSFYRFGRWTCLPLDLFVSGLSAEPSFALLASGHAGR